MNMNGIDIPDSKIKPLEKLIEEMVDKAELIMAMALENADDNKVVDFQVMSNKIILVISRQKK